MKRAAFSAVSVAVVLAVLAACSGGGREQILGRDGDSGVAPSFVPDAGEGGSEANAVEAGTALECISTTCPAPFATCSAAEPPCSIDLSSNPLHCGDCDVACPSLPGTTFTCAHGTCVEACTTSVADCDGLLETGCETQVTFFDQEGTALPGDPSNCGGCGVTCAAGVPCYGAACGCPGGGTLCSDGSCVNLNRDNANCGACGHACELIVGQHDPPPPANASYQCVSGKCATQCTWPFEDCNGNSTDGCETPIGTEQNCSKCGDQCARGVKCYTKDQISQCGCPSGQIDCQGTCTDVSTVNNCGGCGMDCTSGADVPQGGYDYVGNTLATCDNGKCAFACKPGFADKDGTRLNGCEINTSSDPNNCGALGVVCDVDAGQPCVNGKCLTAPCAPGTTK